MCLTVILVVAARSIAGGLVAASTPDSALAFVQVRGERGRRVVGVEG